MSIEDEEAFIRLMLGFVEEHKLRTPDSNVRRIWSAGDRRLLALGLGFL
jgi:hypothetical protein